MKRNVFLKEQGVHLIILMLLAYLFSFVIRLYWPMIMGDNPSMTYNGELMINTNDGYFFATSIKDLLNGIDRNSLGNTSALEITPAFVYVAVFLQKILPISFETLILYMPSIIASLVVIPIILTFRLINHTYLGFLAALIGSIAWSYYNRTMVGYFDSDMFSVFLMFFIFYSFLRVVYKKDIGSIVFASLLISIYPFFYPQGLSLIYALFFLLIFYTILEYKKIVKVDETISFNEDKRIIYYALSMFSIAIIFILNFWVKLVIFVALTLLYKRNALKKEHWVYLSLVIFLLFLYFGNVFNILTSKLFVYIDRGTQENGLHFFQVVQTVREAGQIPLSVIADRISGSSIGLVISLIGYIVLVYRHKPFILALPLIGIGLFAYIGGLRFTVYAVPVAALSAVYLFWVLSSYIKKETKYRYIFATLLTIIMLIPNIIHIKNYIVPTVFNKHEVQVLEKLKSVSNIDDYTLAWWDYGYPIWFYSDTNTLIDGGKHQNDNFIISEILLTDSQLEAARLARISIETFAKHNFRGSVADILFKNGKKDQLDPTKYLENLKYAEDVKLPPKTRDIFLYLPYRMLNILPTVKLFSNLDLKDGQKFPNPFFYKTDRFNDNGKQIHFGNGIYLDKARGMLHFGQQKTPLKRFVVTEYDDQMKLQKNIQVVNPNARISLIYLKSYNSFLILDEKIYNSVYIKLFILQEYDKNLFEPVVLSPWSSVYRLKI